jgi:DNA-binding PadR family transcriptional regulator
MKQPAPNRTPRLARIREIDAPMRAGAKPMPAKASLEHALLGLVAEMPGITGYDLAKVFALSMQHYWHAHQGQIYPTLDRMERAGLIRSREIIQRGRPNKRVFTIAPAGARMLVEWLESPIDELRMKHSQLMRTRFLGHLSADGARRKIQEQRAGWERNLKVFRAIERDVFAGREYSDLNDMFAYFTLRYGIEWMEQNIRWCDWAISEIERKRALFEPTPSREKAGVEPRAGVRKGRSIP